MSTEANWGPITFIAGTIAIISAFVNILLIYLASKVKEKSKDIILVLLCSSIELFIPLVSISDLTISSLFGRDGTSIPVVCQFLGFFTMSAFFGQLICNALLAIDRMCKVTNSKIDKYAFFPIISAAAVYIIFSIVTAALYLYKPVPSGIICLISHKETPLSIAGFSLFCATLLICSIMIFYCYFRITVYTNRVTEFLKINNENNIVESNFKRNSNIKYINVKIYCLLFVYSVCMIGGLVLTITMALLDTIGQDKYKDILPTISDLLTLMICTGFTFNGLLVIFIHKGIQFNLKKLVNIIKSR